MIYNKDLPSYGDLITVGEFLVDVRERNFTDWDGSGHPVKNGKMAAIDIYPSKVNDIPADATHIIWFNK